MNLKMALEMRTTFHAAKQYLAIIRGSHVIPLQADNSKSLYELRIQEGDNISLESGNKNNQNWKSRALRYTEMTTEVVSLRVLNYCANTLDDNVPGAAVNLTLKKENTLNDVIVQAVSAWKLDTPIQELQLRRVKVYSNQDNVPEGVYGNNNLKLVQVGLGEGGEVILERISFPTISGVELRFVFAEESKKHVDLLMMCRSTWTLRQLKEAVCKIADLDPQHHRMQKTNFWKKPVRLLDNEDLLVKQIKFSEGDTLWIEGGGAPIKGQVHIAVDLYTVLPPENEKEKEKEKEKESTLLPEDASFEEEGEKKSSAVDEKRKGKDSSLYSPLLHLSKRVRYDGGARFSCTEVFSLQTSIFSTLLELKQKIHARSEFSHLPSCHHLRIWNHVRVLKMDDATLKSQSVSHDCHLTVQVLDHEDMLTKPTDTLRTLFYVHKRDSEKKVFSEPFEFYYDGNSSLELAEKLSAMIGIVKENMMIAHYQYLRDTWELLFYGEEPGDVEPEASQNTKNLDDTARADKLEELPSKEIISAPVKRKRKRQRQWIPDGTILVVKDLSKDTKNEDDFTVVGMNADQESTCEGVFRRATQTQITSRGREAVLKIYVADEEFEWVSEDESDSE
eukprot:TRINITY_DN109_c0_g1_i3.p1 TRINITY_DN109_c0_g1~~TRINITY_DN109_c0_g1_i3.p1  ORF type:complete len:618 (-),score=111.69 TRINITY_DN109_c0_g1_i3:69-1922(-)